MNQLRQLEALLATSKALADRGVEIGVSDEILSDGPMGTFPVSLDFPMAPELDIRKLADDFKKAAKVTENSGSREERTEDAPFWRSLKQKQKPSKDHRLSHSKLRPERFSPRKGRF